MHRRFSAPDIDFGVDRAGEVREVDVRRALVASTARLTYAQVDDDAARGALHPSLRGLPEFGWLRAARALDRGAVALDLPDQEVYRGGRDRTWSLRIAPKLAAEQWNSQLSLLTGECAGAIMVDAGVGLLRTLPPASKEAVATLGALADALEVSWPTGATPGEFLASLPPAEPTTLALMSAGATLMRGAGYRVLDGSPVSPQETGHAGVGSAYAHVTAPLRRLGDRFATEVVLAVTAGQAVPDWVTRALPTLPKILRSADARAAGADRASVDLAEAVVLADQVGRRFDAVVMRSAADKRPAQVLVHAPAIIAGCDGAPEAGRGLKVQLAQADPATRTVRFVPAAQSRSRPRDPGRPSSTRRPRRRTGRPAGRRSGRG